MKNRKGVADIRSLERNKQKIYYALYLDDVEEMDEEGNYTGEKITGYSNPIDFKINSSASRGEASTEQFGISLDYDKVLCSCDTILPIDETTVLWVDIKPVLDENGATKTKHDYIVKKVAKSLNSVQYAIKKV
ncbi:hypothetical protein [Anaerosporobacter sp.]|uniref:hypothetical protein n=1 Tax=Anaerosporobacter sp. TaxID=1872529 RepID=UPI00286EF18D|nr:hypothetical protein [Anaerosporobacter sp.]